MLGRAEPFNFVASAERTPPADLGTGDGRDRLGLRSSALRAFGLVVVYEIVVLVVLLRTTASENGWLAQVRTGSLAALVAAPIVFAQSLLFTLVLFPSYTTSHPEAGSEVAQAFAGVMGTIGTGVIASAIIGAFARRRG